MIQWPCRLVGPLSHARTLWLAGSSAHGVHVFYRDSVYLTWQPWVRSCHYVAACTMLQRLVLCCKMVYDVAACGIVATCLPQLPVPSHPCSRVREIPATPCVQARQPVGASRLHEPSSLSSSQPAPNCVLFASPQPKYSFRLRLFSLLRFRSRPTAVSRSRPSRCMCRTQLRCNVARWCNVVLCVEMSCNALCCVEYRVW
jgi:hypothetical protein